MRRGLILIPILAAAGCDKAKPTAAVTPVTPATKSGTPAAVAPQPAAAPAEPTIADAPGMNRWTDAQLLEAVREDLKMPDLTLAKAAGNRYTGTGTVDGQQYAVTVWYRGGEYLAVAKAAVAGGGAEKRSHWAAEGVEKKFGR